MSNTTETGWPLRSEAAAEATEKQFIARVGGIVELRRDAIIAALEKEKPRSEAHAYAVAIEAAGLPGLIAIVEEWAEKQIEPECEGIPGLFSTVQMERWDSKYQEGIRQTKEFEQAQMEREWEPTPIIDPTETE